MGYLLPEVPMPKPKLELILSPEGFALPDYTFTFFPEPIERLRLEDAGSRQLAKMIKRQPNLSSRFIHQLISSGRQDEAEKVLELLGGPEPAKEHIDQDWRSLFFTMITSFVPKDEVERVRVAFNSLGFADLDIPKRLGVEIRQTDVDIIKDRRPTREELESYVNKYNCREILPDSRVEYTKWFRMLDPTRALRYVGLGHTHDYDWVNIYGVDGYEQKVHYMAADNELKIALLRLY